MPTPLTDATLGSLPWQQRLDDWRGLVSVSMGQLDELLERTKAAVKVRWPSTAPADSLRYHGSDRLLPRFPSESDAQYRARLAGAMALWGTAGTAGGLVALLASAGFVDGTGAPAARVYDAWMGPSWWPGGAGAWPPSPRGPEPSWWAAYAASVSVSTAWPPAAGSDACRALWSRVWVELPLGGPFGWARVNWGDALVWGDENDAALAGTSPWVWGGVTGTPAQFAFVRGLIRQWVPARSVCPGFFLRDAGTGFFVEMPGA